MAGSAPADALGGVGVAEVAAGHRQEEAGEQVHAGEDADRHRHRDPAGALSRLAKPHARLLSLQKALFSGSICQK